MGAVGELFQEGFQQGNIVGAFYRRPRLGLPLRGNVNGAPGLAAFGGDDPRAGQLREGAVGEFIHISTQYGRVIAVLDQVPERQLQGVVVRRPGPALDWRPSASIDLAARTRSRRPRGRPV